jgi:prefoldin subunit 5
MTDLGSSYNFADALKAMDERVSTLERQIREVAPWLADVSEEPEDVIAKATARFRAANKAKQRAGVKPPGRK